MPGPSPKYASGPSNAGRNTNPSRPGMLPPFQELDRLGGVSPSRRDEFVGDERQTYFFVGGHFEHLAHIGLADERVAVGEPLAHAALLGVKRRGVLARVRPGK